MDNTDFQTQWRGVMVQRYTEAALREGLDRILLQRLSLPQTEARMDAWIDPYHAIKSLTRHDVRVMVTVGSCRAGSVDGCR